MRRFVSIKWKLLAVCLAFVTLPTVILGAIIYNTYRNEASANTMRDLRLIASGWHTVADVYYEELNRILRREQHLVEQRLSSVALDVRKMLEYYDSLPPHAKSEKAYQSLLDRIASIKVGRRGYVFLIDTNNVYSLSYERKLDGSPVISSDPTSLDRNFHRMISSARNLRGEDTAIENYDWVEPGTNDPRQTVTALAHVPAMDMVVGATAFYNDFKSTELMLLLKDELLERMSRQKIGSKGYVFAFNTSGDYVVSKDRLRDGENFYDYQDDQGRYLIREIIKSAMAAKRGETISMRYSWKNLDDDRPYKKAAAVVYHEGWNWVIGASAYEEDFLKGLAVIKWDILRICLTFIVFGGLIAFFFSIHITRPILKLEGVAASGNLNTVMDASITSSNDEIGNLGMAFEKMMASLREKIGEIESSRGVLIAKNEELRQAQKQLIQSEKLAAIGQLAAGVAHEINNPLAYVMSNMETLEKYVQHYEDAIKEIESVIGRQHAGSSGQEALADLKLQFRRIRDPKLERARQDIKSLMPELKDGLDRVKRIVMDLRTYARTKQEGKVQVHIEDILEQVITIVWNQVKYKAQLVREYSMVAPIKCHPQQVGQVFINILMNAAQAIEGDKGVIKLKTYADDKNVYVDIIDNGIGIEEENMSKIFEPFFTTKPVGAGTGLGLSISYEIVRNHGGSISVKSAPHQGSTFIVALPLDGQSR